MYFGSRDSDSARCPYRRSPLLLRQRKLPFCVTFKGLCKGTGGSVCHPFYMYDPEISDARTLCTALYLPTLACVEEEAQKISGTLAALVDCRFHDFWREMALLL